MRFIGARGACGQKASRCIPAGVNRTKRTQNRYDVGTFFPHAVRRVRMRPAMGLWTSTKAAGRLLATEPDRENSADSRLLQGEPFLRPSLRHHEEGGARRHAGRAGDVHPGRRRRRGHARRHPQLHRRLLRGAQRDRPLRPARERALSERGRHGLCGARGGCGPAAQAARLLRRQHDDLRRGPAHRRGAQCGPPPHRDHPRRQLHDGRGLRHGRCARRALHGAQRPQFRPNGRHARRHPPHRPQSVLL